MQNVLNNFDDLLDRATQALRDQVPHDVPPKETVAMTKATAIQLTHAPVLVAKPTDSRGVRRWAIASIAIAASVMVAVFFSFRAPIAFAQVVEQLKQIKTATFTVEFKGVKQLPDLTAQATVKSPDMLRFDFDLPNKLVNITNGAAGELIAYDGDSDEVRVNEIAKAQADNDILKRLQNVDADAVELNLENAIAGTDLYSIFDGQGRVWVDKTSKLPTRIEFTSPAEMGGSEVVYRNFQWNVAVDDQLFRIPAGRAIVRSSLLAPATEAELIAAFQIRQAFSQEPYEADFFAKDVALRLGRLAYDLSKNRAQNAEIQSVKLMHDWPTIGISVTESQDPKLVQQRIDYLCMKLDDWRHRITGTGGWVGEGVQPGEARPLCWWKVDGKIRVLRGDLKIIDADQPPAQN